jgi:hemoglobin-like flavoprotein
MTPGVLAARRRSFMGFDSKVLRESFAMLAARDPELTHRFYDFLFARHPEVRFLFHTRPMAAQARLLRDALVALLEHVDDQPWVEAYLTPLGARHAVYGVTDEMYDWVGQALLDTFAEVGGTDWTVAMAAAWSEAYALVAQIMKQGAVQIGVPGADRDHRPRLT